MEEGVVGVLVVIFSFLKESFFLLYLVGWDLIFFFISGYEVVFLIDGEEFMTVLVLWIGRLEVLVLMICIFFFCRV